MCVCVCVVFQGVTAQSGLGPSHYPGFMITLRHTTFCRTPLDRRSARRGDLYFTTHNTHKRQTSRHPMGFEPAIPVSDRPQTHALHRAENSLVACLLTPCSRVLLEKLTGFQPVKKFPACHRTRKFITAFTSARHLSLS